MALLSNNSTSSPGGKFCVRQQGSSWVMDIRTWSPRTISIENDVLELKKDGRVEARVRLTDIRGPAIYFNRFKLDGLYLEQKNGPDLRVASFMWPREYEWAAHELRKRLMATPDDTGALRRVVRPSSTAIALIRGTARFQVVLRPLAQRWSWLFGGFTVPPLAFLATRIFGAGIEAQVTAGVLAVSAALVGLIVFVAMSRTLKLVVEPGQWEFLAGKRRLAGGPTSTLRGFSIARVDGRISNLVLVTSDQSHSLFPASDEELEWLGDELQTFLKSKEENNLSSASSW